MAGDHGVVAEGVSPFPQDVTWQMVANFSAGGAAIKQIARSVGAGGGLRRGCRPRSDGVAGIDHVNVSHGTANMAQGPAMSREQCAEAVMVGVEAARAAVERGVALIGTGEMGIGNTTSAAALTAAFTGVRADARRQDGEPAWTMRVWRTRLRSSPVRLRSTGGRARPARHAGRGRRSGDRGACGRRPRLGRARSACRERRLHLGGRDSRGAQALPDRSEYVIPSHLSAEPGHAVVLDAIGVDPVFDLDMRLGEGTGAALAMGVIDAACAMMSGMATFGEAGVDGAEESGA